MVHRFLPAKHDTLWPPYAAEVDAPWRARFPDTDDLHDLNRREWELNTPTSVTSTSPSSTGATSTVESPTVTEDVGPGGSTVLRVRPPDFGPGSWAIGAIVGSALIGMAVLVAVAPAGGEHSIGSVVAAAATLVLGIVFLLLMLSQEHHWRFDSTGIHRITGLGRRTTPWTDVARVRLVFTGDTSRGAFRRRTRLHFMDASGRSLVDLPHVTRTSRVRRAAGDDHHDLDVLRYVADECARKGWLIGVGDDRPPVSRERRPPR